MANPDPLMPLRRRALRHALGDGAIDLLLGLFTLIVAVGTQRRAFIALAAVYLAVLAVAWRPLHDRLTSQRLGYAELPYDPARPLLAVVLIAGCLTMTVVAAATLPFGRVWALEHWPRWSPLVAGAVLAAGFAHAAWHTRFVRFAVYAAVSALSAVFFWLFPFGPAVNASDRLTLPLFVVAAVMLAGGAATMASFVHRHPLVSSQGGSDVG
jgi:hypothetical protein